jgi:hypothetical protein
MPSRKRAGLELVLAERRAAAHREPGERGGAALDAQRNRKRQQLSKEQLALFEALWKANDPEEEDSEPAVEQERDEPEEPCPFTNSRA